MNHVAGWLATFSMVTAISGCAGNTLIRYDVPIDLAAAAKEECSIKGDRPVNQPHEVEGTIVANRDKCKTTSIENNEPYYRLVIVEFDDQGRLRKDRQLKV